MLAKLAANNKQSDAVARRQPGAWLTPGDRLQWVALVTALGWRWARLTARGAPAGAPSDRRRGRAKPGELASAGGVIFSGPARLLLCVLVYRRRFGSWNEIWARRRHSEAARRLAAGAATWRRAGPGASRAAHCAPVTQADVAPHLAPPARGSRPGLPRASFHCHLLARDALAGCGLAG